LESGVEARGHKSQSDVDPVDDAEEIRRIRALPKEVGVLLVIW
jgi:hypothetical protein